MEEYIKSLIFITIIVAVLLQMLPGEKYQKIVGMVAGWLILLVFMKPLFQTWNVGQLWKRQFLKSQYEVFSSSRSSMAELTEHFFEEELKDYVSAYSGYAFEDIGVEVIYKSKEQKIKKIRIKMPFLEDEKKNAMIKQLAKLFDIEDSCIAVHFIQEGEKKDE